MTGASPILTKSFVAGTGGLTKRRFAVMGSADGQAVLATGGAAAILGVVGDLTVAAGKMGDVHVMGVAEVECGGTVTRGLAVTSDAAGKAVNATTEVYGGGIALSSGADGDIVPILVVTPQRLDPAAIDGVVRTVVVSATLAELNGASGKTLVAAVAGKKIRVHHWIARDVGGFSAAAGTSLDIEDTNGTPVKVAVIAKAALTSGAVVMPSTPTTVTNGAGFGADLTVSEALRAIWVGTDADAGTSVTFTIAYSLAS